LLELRSMHALCYLTQHILSGFSSQSQLPSDVASFRPITKSKSGSNSILEEIIEITERPFGVQFDRENGPLIVQHVVHHSLAEKEGLQIGDKLIKINNTSVDRGTMSASKAIQLFCEAPLPFIATFEKSLANIIPDRVLKSNSPAIEVETEPPNVRRSSVLSSMIAAKKVFATSSRDSCDDLNVFESLPFSPKDSDSEDDDLSEYNEDESANVVDVDLQMYSERISIDKECVNEHDVHLEENNEQLEEDRALSETDSVCSFSFIDGGKLGDDHSFASSSVETPLPVSPKLSNMQQSVQLLKDLLSESDKARRLNVIQHSNHLRNDDLDDANTQRTPSSPSLSNSQSCSLTERKVEDLQPMNAKQFIQTFLWMDVERHFNEYICHTLLLDHDSAVVKSSPRTKSTLRLKLSQMSHSTTFNDRGRRALMDNQSQNVCTEDKVVAILASSGFSEGFHQWSLKILQCDIYRQEMGVIGTNNIKYKRVDVNGIIASSAFGARAVYGNELLTDSLYYASFDEDNNQRCFKDLSKSSKIGWCTGDVIKVSLDLKKWKVKFYRNNHKVRKTISLQPNRVYYPIFAFSGHCRYELLDFK